MWRTYWQLRFDPFLGPESPYVPTAGHEEAAARLGHAVVNRLRLATLRGPSGVGKSLVLSRVVAEYRDPRRRFVRVRGSDRIEEVAGALAAALGRTRRRHPTLPALIRIVEALRLARLQRLDVVLVIDDAEGLDSSGDLERLARIAEGLTIVAARRDPSDRDGLEPRLVSSPVATLVPLTFTETARYLDAKIASAGSSGPIFDRSAALALYDRSGGIPARLDLLASLALIAGAADRLDRVDAGLVAAVAEECDDRAGGWAA